MPDSPWMRRTGWILPGILLGVYVILKLLAWGYARQASDLERQMAELRPALSAKVLYEQLEGTRRACIQVSEQIRQMDLDKTLFVEQLSHLPASITIEKLEVRRPQKSLRIEGIVLPGIRSPESVLVPWAQRVGVADTRVTIRKLVPIPKAPGSWRFELQVEDA